MNKLPSERANILAIIPPDAATTARTSAYVSPANYGRLRVVVLIGDASATGTLTLIKAADTNGGSSASIATQAYGGTGSVGDNKAVVFNVGQFDDFFDSTRPYFAIGLGGSVANCAGIIEGWDERFAPATNSNVTVAR